MVFNKRHPLAEQLFGGSPSPTVVPKRPTFFPELQVGVAPPQPARRATYFPELQVQQPTAPVNDYGVLDDTFGSFAQGGIGGIKALVDTFGADSAVSESLGKDLDYWRGRVSPERKAELDRQAAESAALGEDAGFLDRAGLAARQALRNPLQTAAEAFGNVAPLGMVGRAAGALNLGARATAGALGTAMGAGAIKGNIYDTTLQTLTSQGVPLEEASARAAEAQAYATNPGKIALGAGVGALASRVGVDEALIGAAMGKRAAGKVLTDVERAELAKALTNQAKDFSIKGGVRGLLKEGLSEGPQEAIETGLGNLGAIDAGGRIDPWANVVESGVKGGIMGAIAGAPGNVAGGYNARQQLRQLNPTLATDSREAPPETDITGETDDFAAALAGTGFQPPAQETPAFDPTVAAFVLQAEAEGKDGLKELVGAGLSEAEAKAAMDQIQKQHGTKAQRVAATKKGISAENLDAKIDAREQEKRPKIADLVDQEYQARIAREAAARPTFGEAVASFEEDPLARSIPRPATREEAARFQEESIAAVEQTEIENEIAQRAAEDAYYADLLSREGGEKQAVEELQQKKNLSVSAAVKKKNKIKEQVLASVETGPHPAYLATVEAVRGKTPEEAEQILTKRRVAGFLRPGILARAGIQAAEAPVPTSAPAPENPSGVYVADEQPQAKGVEGILQAEEAKAPAEPEETIVARDRTFTTRRETLPNGQNVWVFLGKGNKKFKVPPAEYRAIESPDGTVRVAQIDDDSDNPLSGVTFKNEGGRLVNVDETARGVKKAENVTRKHGDKGAALAELLGQAYQAGDVVAEGERPVAAPDQGGAGEGVSARFGADDSRPAPQRSEAPPVNQVPAGEAVPAFGGEAGAENEGQVQGSVPSRAQRETNDSPKAKPDDKEQPFGKDSKDNIQNGQGASILPADAPVRSGIQEAPIPEQEIATEAKQVSNQSQSAPKPDLKDTVKPKEQPVKDKGNESKADRPQVAQPTKYGGKVTVQVPGRDGAREETGSGYLLPGFEEFTFVAVPPSGSKAKATKLGWRIYEQSTGMMLSEAMDIPGRPTSEGEAVTLAMQRLNAFGKQRFGERLKAFNEGKQNDEAKATPQPVAVEKPEREALIQRIVEAAKQPRMAIKERFELKGTDGNWYRGDMPRGVNLASPVERRTYGFAYQTPQGTFVGTVGKTFEEMEERQQKREEEQSEAFADTLRKKSDAELQEQADYWLKGQKPKDAKPEPKPEQTKHEMIVELLGPKPSDYSAQMRHADKKRAYEAMSLFDLRAAVEKKRADKARWARWQEERDAITKPFEARTNSLKKQKAAAKTKAERDALDDAYRKDKAEVDEALSKLSAKQTAEMPKPVVSEDDRLARLKRDIKASDERIAAAKENLERAKSAQDSTKGKREKAKLQQRIDVLDKAYDDARRAGWELRDERLKIEGDPAQKIIAGKRFDQVDEKALTPVVREAVEANPRSKDFTKAQLEAAIKSFASNEWTPFYGAVIDKGLEKAVDNSLDVKLGEIVQAKALDEIKQMEGLDERTGYGQMDRFKYREEVKRAYRADEIEKIMERAREDNKKGLAKKAEDARVAAQQAEMERQRVESLKEPVPAAQVAVIQKLTIGEYNALKEGVSAESPFRMAAMYPSEQVLKRLGARGLVEKQMDPLTKTEEYVETLTPAGQEMAKAVERYDARLKNGIPFAERGRLKARWQDVFYKDSRLVLGKANGRDFHSTGHWIVEGKRPAQSEGVEVFQELTPDRLSATLTPKKKVEKITPVAYFESDTREHVVMSNGSAYNASYFDYVSGLHPDAEFFGADETDTPVYLKAKDGRTVGVIMPIRHEATPGVQAILDAKPAEAEKPAPAKEAPKAEPKKGKRAKPAFERKSSAEDARDLILQHNLSAEKLIHADRMGGLAVPSFAVAKADAPLEGFGDISLIGDRDLADPRKSGMGIFSGDIYSPRYPTIEHKVSAEALKELNKRLEPFRGDARMIYGSEIRNADDLIGDTGFKRYVEAKLGKNWTHAQAKSMAHGLLNAVGAEERIFKGFTNSGNRRYTPHTLEVVVKMLKRDMQAGEGFNYGVGTVRAAVAPKFRSMSDVRANKDRLVTKDQMEEAKKEVDAEFWEIAEALPKAGNPFGQGDRVSMMMVDAAKMGIDRALAENGFDFISPEAKAEAKQDIREFMEKLRTMPTEYFEAKLKRAVGIDEFKVAVVPSDVNPNALAILEKNGLRVEKYDKNDPADRKRVIKAASEDVAFERRDIERPGGMTEAEWANYNGRKDADRGAAYAKAPTAKGAPAGVRVVDFEGDVDKQVITDMVNAGATAALASRVAQAVSMIQKHVPALKFGGFTPAGNLHGVNVDGKVFVNQLATHQIAVEVSAKEGITYHEAFAREMVNVLIHEAAHYAEKGHGDAFKAEMARIKDELGRNAVTAMRRDFMRYASDNKNRSQNQRMYEKALPGWREGERRGREAARADARAEGSRGADAEQFERLRPRPRGDTGGDGDAFADDGRQGSLPLSGGEPASGVDAPAFVRGDDGRVDPRKPSAPIKPIPDKKPKLKQRIAPVLKALPEAEADQLQALYDRFAQDGDAPVTWEAIDKDALATLGVFTKARMDALKAKGIDFDAASFRSAVRMVAEAQAKNQATRRKLEAAGPVDPRSKQYRDHVASSAKLAGWVLAINGDQNGAARAFSIAENILSSKDSASSALETLFNETGGLSKKEAADVVAMSEKDPSKLAAVFSSAFQPGFVQKVNEWRKGSMLFSLRTYGVNFGGNVLKQALSLGMIPISAAVDKATNQGTRQVYSGEQGAAVAGIADFGREALSNFVTETKAALRGEESFDPEENRQYEQRTPAIKGPIGKFIRTPFRLLQAADNFFKATARAQSLYREAYRRAANQGLKGEALQKRMDALISIGKQSEWKAPEVAGMMGRAVRDSQYETFTLPANYETAGAFGALADLLGKAEKRVKIIGPVIGLAIPFKNTPAHIAYQSWEHSPFGFISARMRALELRDLYRDISVAKGDQKAAIQAKIDAKQRDLANQVARATVGSALFLSGFALAAAGLLTGSGPPDWEKKRVWEEAGNLPNAINLGGTWYGYDRFEPIAAALGIAANARTIKDAEGLKESLGAFSEAMKDAWLSKTYLQGLEDFADLFMDPARYGENFMRDLAGSFVPAFSGQTVEDFDPIVRDKKATPFAPITSRIPGLSDDLPASHTGRGDLAKRTGRAGQGILPAALNPFGAIRARSANGDPLAAEMTVAGYASRAHTPYLEIGVGPSGAKRKERVELTEAEREAFRRADEAVSKRFREVIAGPTWKTLTPEQRLAAFRKAYDRASASVRDRILPAAQARLRAKMREAK